MQGRLGPYQIMLCYYIYVNVLNTTIGITCTFANLVFERDWVLSYDLTIVFHPVC